MVNKAYVIRIQHHRESEDAADRLIKSNEKFKNEFEIEKYTAIIPDDVPVELQRERLEWTYPWEGEIKDMRSGLTLKGYETADPSKRIACFLSHYFLWKRCVHVDEPMLIFEHDAIFTARLYTDLLSKSKYDIIGLNDPRGATRLSGKFWEKMQNFPYQISAVPRIDDHTVPQGLAGNSAYYIRPAGASKLLELVKEHGAWPNDAIMCRQLMPQQLGVLRSPVTKIQGIDSTTTL